ncbi:hypothetical protein J6590_028408 [Homalodisca vitripennis]|nr:hypothetical protein J6590_028408 [Homalodisca vitripennis]
MVLIYWLGYKPGGKMGCVTAPWLFFDGKLFQIKYNEAGSGYSHSRLCDNRVDVLEVFQVARSVVFYNDY